MGKSATEYAVQAEATPRPWYVEDQPKDDQAVRISTRQKDTTLGYSGWDGLAVVAYGCDDEPDKGAQVAKANAALIVKAVNAYDRDQEVIRALVEALKPFSEVTTVIHGEWINAARAALRLAQQAGHGEERG